MYFAIIFNMKYKPVRLVHKCEYRVYVSVYIIMISLQIGLAVSKHMAQAGLSHNKPVMSVQLYFLIIIILNSY